MLGTVKRFNSKKGFGFVTDENGTDFFFHYSSLVMEGFKTIKAGTKVEFETKSTDKGLQAISIKPIE